MPAPTLRAAKSKVPGGGFLSSPERVAIAFLVAVAFLRTFLFCAAFPFFNNVDETAHADTVLKYARGHWPRDPEEHYDAETGRLITLMGSWEFTNPPGRIGPPYDRPRWVLPENVRGQVLDVGKDKWVQRVNHEALSPPVYYALAALWYRAGGLVGMHGPGQLYLVRFLNAFLVSAMAAGVYLFCARQFPDRVELRTGAAMLAAFLPQDVFYSINNDALSPVLFLGAAAALLEWNRAERPSAALGALAGSLAALTFLVKFTNVPVALLLAVIASRRARRAARAGQLPALLPGLGALLIASALPVALCFARNYVYTGDFTATGEKIEQLRMAPRPWGRVLEHPLFSITGLWTFWDHLMRSIWRGELTWHGQRMAHPLMDWMYTVSSTVFLGGAMAGGFRAWRSLRQGSGNDAPPFACNAAQASMMMTLLAGIVCLMWLSVSFDYEHSVSPSKAHPYFSNGRYLSGILPFFLVLYVQGLAFLTRGAGRERRVLRILAGWSVLMTLSELALSADAFRSPFNWFHL